MTLMHDSPMAVATVLLGALLTGCVSDVPVRMCGCDLQTLGGWEERKGDFIESMAELDPEIISFRGVTESQGTFLREMMPSWEVSGTSNLVCYCREIFEERAAGEESVGAGASCQWKVLRDRRTDARFLFGSVLADWKGDEAETAGVAALAEFAASRAPGLPVVWAGASGGGIRFAGACEVVAADAGEEFAQRWETRFAGVRPPDFSTFVVLPPVPDNTELWQTRENDMFRSQDKSPYVRQF